MKTPIILSVKKDKIIMDMAVADLFKHKIDFRITHEENHYGSKELRYVSMLIENKLSIDVRHIYELCLNRIRLFIVHFISTFVTEESERINFISVFVELWNLWEGEDIYPSFRYREVLMTMILDNPRLGIHQFPSNTDPIIYSGLETIINAPFRISVTFRISMPTIRPDRRRPSDDRVYPEDISGGSFSEEDDYEENTPAPLIEAHRRERSVICLEAEPNILYLNCTHIAVCDSCDGRSNQCDVCQAEISKRIKI